MNAKNAVKAIRFERIPPMGPTIFDAPIEIASKMLLASLFYNKIFFALGYY